MFSKKWFLFGGLTLFVFVLAGVGAYFFFNNISNLDDISFELIPTVQAQGGILSDSSFVLKSSEPVRVPVIKKYLSFEPKVDYTVKKIDSLGKEYEIIPTEPLEEQKVYAIFLGQDPSKSSDQAWAYQVEAPFGVIKTIPGIQGTSVPIDTGIEFELNRDLGIVDSSSVSLEPATLGRIETKSKTLVFIPQQELAYRTLYTVTLKKGLATGDGKEQLQENYSFSFETMENPEQEVLKDTRPYVSFDWKPLWEFAPDKEPLFTVQTRNISEIPFSLYKFSNSDTFISKYSTWRNPDYSWTRFYRERVLDLSMEQNILEFKASPQRQDPFTFIRIPQKLPEGFYVLRGNIDSGQDPIYAFFQVSSLIGMSVVSNANSMVWVKSNETKSGLADVSVSYNKNLLGKTDKQGVLLFKNPQEFMYPQDTASDTLKDTQENREPFLVLTSGEKNLLLSAQTNVSKPDAWWTSITTDKPVYLPNDTIHVWGIMKRRDGTDIKNNEVTIQLRDGYDYSDEAPVYAENKARVSAYSTITGDVSFSSVRPGYYSLAVYLGKELVLSKGITIATYTKPAYSLTIDSDKQAVFVGDEVRYSLTAEFFDNTPVSNLPVVLSIPNFPPREIILDSQGRGNVKIKMSKDAISEWSLDSGDSAFITATVAPKNEEEGEISASVPVVVFPARKILAIESAYKNMLTAYSLQMNDVDLLKKNQEYSSDYTGNPTPNYSVTVEVTKIEYKKRLVERKYDEYTKTTYPVYESDQITKKILTKELKTDAEGKTSFEWKAEKDTSYEIVFSFREKDGRVFSKTMNAYGGGWYGEQEPSLGITVKNNNNKKTEYDIGEQMSVSMEFLNGGLPQEEREKFMFLRAVNGSLSYTLSDTPIYQDSFKEEFIPNLELNGIWFSGQQFYVTNGWSGGLGFSYKNEERRLRVNLTTDKKQYRPRETVQLNVEVKDKGGKPRKGEVNIAVIDEALRTFGEQDEVLTSLYRNIYSSVSFVVSHENPLASMAEGGGCFSSGTRVKTPTGFKNIEDMRAGDVIVTRAHPFDSELIQAHVEKITGHYAYEHVVLNDSLVITSNHKLFVNGAWKPAGTVRVGDTLVTQYGEEQVHSVRTFVELRKVYNIEIAGAHTFFADGIYVHNQEKGGGNSLPRSDFKDIVLYKTFETDSQGRANASFTLPDNLTSWFVSTHAFTKDVYAGEGSLSLPVSLPFFIDATLNKVYLTGDEVMLRLRTFGSAGIKEHIEYTIESTTLPVKKITQSGGASLEIPLGKLPQGDHSITVTAKSGTHTDSLVRNVHVADTYFMRPQSDYHQLSSTNNKITLTSNPSGFITMRFCSCTKERYLSLIRSTVWGGLRLDDEIASVLAANLLDNYFKEKSPWYESPQLNSYQKESGGLALLPYADPDLDLSARAAHIIKDHKELMVNEKLLEEYLLSSLTDGKADVHRNASALYGLSVFKSPVLSQLQRMKDDSHLTLSDRIMIALALHSFGARVDARNYYTSFIKSHFTNQAPYLFIRENEKDPEGDIQKTAMAALLAHRIGSEDADKLSQYVFDQYTQTRSLAIEHMQMLQELLPKLPSGDGSFSYSTSKKRGTVTLKQYEPFSLALDPEEFQSLSVQDVKGLVSVVAQYDHETKSSLIKNDQSLKLERWYEVNGQRTNSFQSGDLVKVYVKPTYGTNAHEGGYEIIDYLPSGLKLVSEPGRIVAVVDEDNSPPPPSFSDTDQLDKKQNKKLKGYLKYPLNEEHQKITFSDWYYRKTDSRDNMMWVAGSNDEPFYYMARVVSKGTYTADQALLQSTQTRESAALSNSAVVSIK